jgi:hypothetical protein
MRKTNQKGRATKTIKQWTGKDVLPLNPQIQNIQLKKDKKKELKGLQEMN